VLTITLFTKPNCHLCDEALEEIELAREEIRFELALVNILNDPATYERYKHDIPVVQLNGVEIFRHRLSRSELLEILREESSSEN
jgi:glutaredoxin